MIRPWMIYGAVLALSLGASWMHYTADDSAAEREGVVLLEAKAEELEGVEYRSPELDVVIEQKRDALGTYSWVTVTDRKQKKPAKEGDPPAEPKVTTFKAGGAATEKLLASMGPLMAMRELVGVDDAKLESFALKNSETSVVVKGGGRTASLEIGGETYGAKDLYAKHREATKFYVVDDELVKPLKFASTRLPERALFSLKVEALDEVKLSRGGKIVTWSQHNKDDRSADWWERLPTPGTDEVGKKDESFANWLEKALKLKSSAYVQKGEEPSDLVSQFELTFSVKGKPAESIVVSRSGDDWYASGEFTRGLVKLTKSAVEDTADEVEDILEGREPAPAPADEAPAEPDASPATPPTPPPGLRPGGLPPGMPGLAPRPAPKPG